MIPFILQEYIAELPYCETQIELVNLQGRYGAAGRGLIQINMFLRGEKLRRTITHEIAHCLHIKNPSWLKYFEDPPYISEYASINKFESFAEEFTELYLNGVSTRKQRILRRLLR